MLYCLVCMLWMYTCSCICVWKSEVIIESSSITVHCILLRRSLSLATQQVLELCLSLPPQPWNKSTHGASSSSHGCREHKLQDSCSRSRHFAHWAISSSPPHHQIFHHYLCTREFIFKLYHHSNFKLNNSWNCFLLQMLNIFALKKKSVLKENLLQRPD